MIRKKVMISFVVILLKWSLITVLISILFGILYEQVSRYRLEKKALHNKTFVEINGKQLHYVKKRGGSYTIVFQSGTGSSHAIWQDAQARLSEHATTLSYDRAGIMWSEDTDLPITNQQISDELELLLDKTNCPKPYILVGHSMAGIYLRPFIAAHKQDIAGVVLVESAHPKMLDRSSKELKKVTRSIPPRWLINLAVHSGLYRAMFHFKPLSPEIPMHHALHTLERDFFYRSYAKLLDELDQEAANFKDAERFTDFGDLSLTVIMGVSQKRFSSIPDTALRHEYESLITTSQKDLLHLSSNSRLVKAPNSGHIVQIGDPDIIVTEVQRLIAQHEDGYSSTF